MSASSRTDVSGSGCGLSRRRGVPALVSLCLLTLAAFSGAVPRAGAAEACPNEAVRIGPSANLPNCRAYEMVSPVEKGGQDLVASPVFGFDYVPVISPDGETVTFESYGAMAEPNSNGVVSNYLSRRGSSGWSTEQISPPINPNPSLNTAAAEAFTGDLSKTVFLGPWFPQPSPEANEGTANLYLRDNGDGSFSLITLGAPEELGQAEWQPVVISADGSHVIFATPSFEPPIELTPDSSEAVSPFLYDWAEATGTLTLVGRLPDNSVSPNVVRLAGPTGFGGAFNPAHPVSDDGSHIFFETLGHGGTEQIFVRIDETTTQEVSESPATVADTAHPAHLQLATVDGSIAYFTSSEKLTNDATTGPSDEGEDLYRYDVGTEGLTDITSDPAEEAEGGARVQGVLGGSADGSRLYFVALGDLTPGQENSEGDEAVAGQNNLYTWSEGEGIEFIATGDNSVFPRNWSGGFGGRASRITPDGMHLAFTAANSLTGYPNEGNPEIYLYSAADGELVCASCNPSGEPATSGAAIEDATENIGFPSRNLSSDGRFVFFNTEEALVPRDVNNGEDAYEYDNATGEVSLISTGLSTQGSKFTDATPSGSDALLLTRDQLVGIDTDEGTDAYDARINGGIAAQHPGLPPPPCAGFADCRNVGAPSATTVTGSDTFKGLGNLHPHGSCSALARKARTLNHRARNLRRNAESAGESDAQQLRGKARHLAKRAAKLKKRAKRCQNGNRRAQR